MDGGEIEVEGASLPQGIAVDEAAAYFGVTESADIIMHLNQTDPVNGMGEFFSLTVDLVLQPEFGFEEAAERLGCEAGEIYYLLTGPFGLVTLSDPLRVYLGGEDSDGNPGTNPGLPAHEMTLLESLTDVFLMLKLFGLGHLVGGLSLLEHYLSMYQKLVASPAANREKLLQLATELSAAAEQAKSGSVTPVSCLGAPTHSSPSGSSEDPTISPQPAETPSPAPAQVEPSPTPQETASQETTPQETAPTPMTVNPEAAATSPQPVESESVESSSQPVTGPAPTSPQPVDIIEEQEPISEPEVKPISKAIETTEFDSSEQESAATDAFDSQFSAASEIDSSRTESPSETETAPSQTPRPTSPAVTPKRAPIQASTPAKPNTGWPDQAAPQMPKSGWPEEHSTPQKASALDSVSDLVSGGPHVPQSTAQTIYQNIQSGKQCSGCGIGVEQQWRHCPVCNGIL